MYRASFSHLLVILITSGALGCGEPAVAPPEPDARLIAFSSDSGSSRGSSIFVMHADGTHKVRLTNVDAFDQFPAWSSDGTMLTFDTDRLGGGSKAWAMNADGSNAHLLANGYGARWSPDGTKLIYTGQTSTGIYAVYLANADGSSPVRLTTNALGEVQPTWSPDGAHIVYSVDADGEMNLYISNADGTGQRQLTRTTGFSEAAAWSPDGTRIAFEHGAANQLAAVHVIDVDGTDDRTLTSLGCDAPSWSPDSREIAYQCTTDKAGPQIYSMNADGSGKRVLTKAGFISVGPSWKPVP